MFRDDGHPGVLDGLRVPRPDAHLESDVLRPWRRPRPRDPRAGRRSTRPPRSSGHGWSATTSTGRRGRAGSSRSRPTSASPIGVPRPVRADARNAVMYGPPGRAYVYLVYGMYDCLNVVTGRSAAGAVLIRAVEPIEGVHAMRVDRACGPVGPARLDPRRAGRAAARLDRLPDDRLARGPGLVTAAFGIDTGWTGVDLCDPASPLRLEARPPGETSSSRLARIGVDYAGSPWTELPWRFTHRPGRPTGRDGPALDRPPRVPVDPRPPGRRDVVPGRLDGSRRPWSRRRRPSWWPARWTRPTRRSGSSRNVPMSGSVARTTSGRGSSGRSGAAGWSPALPGDRGHAGRDRAPGRRPRRRSPSVAARPGPRSPSPARASFDAGP